MIRLLLLISLLCACDMQETPSPSPAPPRDAPTGDEITPPSTEPDLSDDSPAAEASLLDVTDGDTIRVMIDGQRERVRLIGIDTPETRNSPRGPEPFADEATEALRALLSESLTLRFDVESRDRFGRLLAYVFVDDLFINAEMVRLGWARPLTIPPNVRHADAFVQLSSAARADERGIWQ